MINVLIVDDDMATRQKIADIVRNYDSNYVTHFAVDGLNAMNFILADEKPDIIITSNQLRRVSGSNLLQAIWHDGDIPTLFHSTHPRGYMEMENGRREHIDLSEHTKLFDFATFKVKNHKFNYIEKFLLDVPKGLLVAAL